MADYQSALIQSLRGASPAFGTSNPGVTLLPNPVVPPMPALNFRRGASLPGGNLAVVPPAPPPAPYVPPPAPVQPPAPPAGGVAPPPDFTPPFAPVMPIGPVEPEVPDYNDDLWGPDPVPVPDYTDDLFGPDPVEPPAEPPAESEPAQTFPVPDQPELEFVDLDPFVPEEQVPVTPMPMPELPDEPPLVDDMEVPELMPVPIEPLDIAIEPPAREPVSLPDEFVDVLEPEVPIEDMGIVIEPPAGPPVSLPDEFVNQLQPDDQLTDQELMELLLFDQISRELLTGPAETPVLPFPDFSEEQ